MNKRIIELANKANEDIGYTFKIEEAKQIHELMEKFAELIVQECMDVVAKKCASPTAYQALAEHFGVEE